MDNYDEDVSLNPFFQAFHQSYPDLFSECVCEQWLICVPRKDSLPKYAFTLEDITHHILKPIPKHKRNLSGESEISSNSLIRAGSSCSNSNSTDHTSSSFLSNSSGSNSCFGSNTGSDGSCIMNSQWNYRTLAQVNVEYSGTKLILDVEAPPQQINNNDLENTNSLSKTREDSPVVRKEVLFEETFYTAEKLKYKVLCVASPLNSKVEDEDLNNGNSTTCRWNLTSLRDCIDFLWVKGKFKGLETFDGYIKLFLHNHRGLENLPLPVQKDVVYTLYLKCLNFSTQSETSGPNPAGSEIHMSDFLYQRLKLATETYVLNGIYRSLISAITSAVSFEDAQLNKIMRNLCELHPQDLEIHEMHWNNLGRAKQELGRMSSYLSPLGKLTCLKKTLRYLKSETEYSESGILSADELIPIWVYLLIKNPIGNWIAQLEFLRHFRFSTIEQKDNENSFYIVTLEASLEHLKTGKVMGIAENERDIGVPCDLGEAWLHTVHQAAMEIPDSSVGELFDVIRLGNCLRLEEIINDYEAERGDQQIENEVKYVDPSLLCHPLCHCDKCVFLSRPVGELPLEPAVNLKSEDGLTVLHMACIYGRPKIVDYLINIKSPLGSQDIQGMAALHFAASRGHQNALLLLLHAGADIEPINHSLNTPLHLAAQNGHEGCVKALVYYAEHSRQTLNVSASNCKGDTPLHFASRWGFQGIVQILVEHGAAINAPNARHTTPLDCAHDIHIQRILQRSLRRRSLVHSNHGDFINIEVVRKEEEGGVVMLISEPKPEPDNEGTELTGTNNKGSTLNTESDASSSKTVSNNNSRSNSRRSSVVAVNGRRNSVSGMPSLVVPSARLRRTSNIVGPGESGFGTAGIPPLIISTPRTRRSSNIIAPGENVGISGMLSLAVPATRSRRSSSIIAPGETGPSIPEGVECCHVTLPADVSDPNFVHNNYLTVDPFEPEHVRKVSVESLEYAKDVADQTAFMGIWKRVDTKDRDIRKLFTAIAIGDVPLALFYLGIPTEEMDNPENKTKEIKRISSCHPLCPCTKCVAKNAGLGLTIDEKNLEGYTPLILSVQYQLTTLVKILIRYRADVNCQSSFEKKTAVDFAKEMDLDEIIDVLESCGATSSTSFTPVIVDGEE